MNIRQVSFETVWRRILVMVVAFPALTVLMPSHEVFGQYYGGRPAVRELIRRYAYGRLPGREILDRLDNLPALAPTPPGGWEAYKSEQQAPRIEDPGVRIEKPADRPVAEPKTSSVRRQGDITGRWFAPGEGRNGQGMQYKISQNQTNVAASYGNAGEDFRNRLTGESRNGKITGKYWAVRADGVVEETGYFEWVLKDANTIVSHWRRDHTPKGQWDGSFEMTRTEPIVETPPAAPSARSEREPRPAPASIRDGQAPPPDQTARPVDENEPPSITRIETNHFEAPTIEPQFRFRAGGKQVVVGQRLRDAIVGNGREDTFSRPNLDAATARHVEVLAGIKDPIDRVQYLARLWKEEKIDTATVQDIVQAYRDGSLDRMVNELHRLLTTNQPDARKTLEFLRNTLANRTREEVFSFCQKYDGLYYRDSINNGPIRLTILNDLEDHFRRNLPDEPEVWREVLSYYQGFDPTSTCRVISDSLKDLHDLNDAPRRTPSARQIALADHVMDVLAALSRENRERCEQIWEQGSPQTLQTVVTKMLVFVDPQYSERVEEIFKREKRNPSSWDQEVFPLEVPAPGSSADHSDSSPDSGRLADAWQTETAEETLSRAIAFYSGTAGHVDYAKARQLFLSASESGDPLAVMWVARCYHKARCGFPMDEAKADELAGKVIADVERLAKAGDPMAMSLWAGAMDDGLGTTQRTEEAFQWYRKAAEAGDVLAMGNFGRKLYQRNEYRQALHWFEEGVANGSTDCMACLGDLYRYGKGVAPDNQESLRWYLKSAQAGDECGMYSVGCMYRDGVGVERDLQQAIHWFRRGAELGHSTCMVNLGDFYTRGEGVDQDYSEAVRLFREAAALNDKVGMFNLAHMYNWGKGVPKDRDRARQWYQKSADAGYELATEAIREIDAEQYDNNVSGYSPDTSGYGNAYSTQRNQEALERARAQSERAMRDYRQQMQRNHPYVPQW